MDLHRIGASWVFYPMIEHVRRCHSTQLPPPLGMLLEAHAVQCLGAQWGSTVHPKMLAAVNAEAAAVFVVLRAEAQSCRTELS